MGKTIMDYVEEVRDCGDKGQVVKELSALLLTIPASRKTARSFIERAIVYVQEH